MTFKFKLLRKINVLVFIKIKIYLVKFLYLMSFSIFNYENDET